MSEIPMKDPYDLAMSKLDGFPGVVKTKATTVRVTDFDGTTRTYVVQTYRRRQPDGTKAGNGDTIFLETSDATGHARYVMPPAVAEVVARQRRAITERSRSKAAKETAEARMAAGWVPTPPPRRGARLEK